MKEPRRLHRLVLDQGFPHHLAVAFSDITTEVRLLCRFLGVEHISPDGEDIGA